MIGRFIHLPEISPIDKFNHTYDLILELFDLDSNKENGYHHSLLFAILTELLFLIEIHSIREGMNFINHCD